MADDDSDELIERVAQNYGLSASDLSEPTTLRSDPVRVMLEHGWRALLERDLDLIEGRDEE